MSFGSIQKPTGQTLGKIQPSAPARPTALRDETQPLHAYLRLAGRAPVDIQGSASEAGHEGSIQVIAFEHHVSRPAGGSGPAGGAAAGRPHHDDILITKPIDRSSPLLMSALLMGESLSKWELRFWCTSPSGQEAPFYTIQLTGASVASIRMMMPGPGCPGTGHQADFEQVAFSYQKIAWTYEDGGVATQADARM